MNPKLAFALSAAFAATACSSPNQPNNAVNPPAAEQCLALKQAQIEHTQITKAEWSNDGLAGADRMSSLTGGSAADKQAAGVGSFINS